MTILERQNSKIVEKVQSQSQTQLTAGFWATYGRQVFASFAANIGAFVFGTTWSWTATALPSMKAEEGGALKLSENQESWLSSILFLGCLFSSVLSSWCIERWGRRQTMLLANFPIVISWLMIGFAPNVEMIYAARFIAGICTACYGAAAPLYISESTHPKIRGRLVCCFDLMVSAGMLFINIVGWFTPWRVQAFVCGAVPLIGHACLLLVPESPRFLVEKGRDEDARKGLRWLQPKSTEEDVDLELKVIIQSYAEDSVESAGGCGIREILDPLIYRPILLGCMLMFFHQFSGNYPILAYGVDIFSAAGSGNPYLGITAINTAQFVASFIPLFLVDTLGRRFLLILSELVMSFCLVAVGLYFYFLATRGPDALDAVDWLPIVALLIYEAFYALGIGPVPWLLMGELISPKKTAISLGIITAVYRVLGFAQLYFFHDFVKVLGLDGIYYFFGVCCLVGAWACWTFVPDTTGKTLDEIHAGGGWGRTRKSGKTMKTTESRAELIIDERF